MSDQTTNGTANPAIRASEKILVSVSEAAALWSISERTMHDLIQAGRVPIVRVGRRVLVPRSELNVAWQELEAAG